MSEPSYDDLLYIAVTEKNDDYSTMYKILDKFIFGELTAAHKYDFVRWLAFHVDQTKKYKIKLYEKLVKFVIETGYFDSLSCKYVAQHRDGVVAWCILNKQGELESLPPD